MVFEPILVFLFGELLYISKFTIFSKYTLFRYHNYMKSISNLSMTYIMLQAKTKAQNDWDGFIQKPTIKIQQRSFSIVTIFIATYDSSDITLIFLLFLS